MSSEQLADGVNPLDAELAATWDVLKGYSGRDTDLGIARRFGGAAAAYSLRDIGAMNGRVVKVRRDVDGQGTDPEENFSANQVQDGTLQKWVNGELESTLPADVATAAAAYSLRKVKASYSGNAVRIRRTSDSVEVNVAFDSDDKVSSSSDITNTTEQGGESGETNATTVAEFLSEERTTFVTNPNFSAVSNVTLDSQTITNTTASITFSGATGAGFIRDNSKPANIGAETGDTVSFDVTASGLNAQAGVRIRVVGANTDIISPAVNDIDNGTQTVSFTVGANSPAGYFAFTNLSTASSATITVSNLKVVGKSATVHTWYDQAGSNDAVQATAANQPKIAESGALLSDGIDFDGTDDYLEADGVSSIYTGTDEAHSSFVVVNSDAATTTQYILGIGSSTDGDPIRNTLFHSGGNLGWQVRDDAGTLKSDLTANPYVANQTYLVSALNSGTTIDFNTNSVINDNGTDADVGASTINTVHIGTRANSPTGYLNGSIQELVFYATDQSDNRFKIESNINNYYGLYNDAQEFSGNPVAAGAASDQVTLSNVSSSGFTAVIGAGSGTKQVNFPFINDIASGEDFFVSFDYTTTNSGITVGVKPRTSSGGSASGDVISATIDGFYGTTGDTTHGGYDVSATATVLSFQTTSSNFTFTVSNLKASKITRNGFVETWYDQSGNGNDATQSSAGIQPVIVSNGGLTKLNNGTPSVGFERRGSNDRRIELSTELTAEPYTFITVGVARGAQPIHILRENATATSTANRPQINIGKTNMKYDADPSTTSGNITVDGDNDFIASFLSSTNGSTADMRFNKSSVNTFTRGAAGNGIGFIGKFDNTSTPFTMVESWIVYESDLSNDIAEIENEITRPIGL
jgi:hypothetical protein